MKPRECPTCLTIGNHEVIEHRHDVPVLQNVIVRSREEAVSFPTREILYCVCGDCGFVWNAAFDEDAIDYSKQYNNSVQNSPYYLKHQRDMALRIVDRGPEVNSINYVEVGCGAGEFIETLNEVAGERLSSVVGFDPVWQGQREFPRKVTVHPEYFTSASASKLPADANVICSRHTIEHIAKPRDFIGEIVKAVKERDLKLFLETPDVAWILRNLAFEDFFYEHCSLFSHKSMRRLLNDHGLNVSISEVYNGQYLWAETNTAAPAGKQDDSDIAELAGHYRVNSAALLEEWREKVRTLKSIGPVAIWGAASKGVTFALLMRQAEGSEIDYGIDLNESKQGCFMPVTAVPIVAPATAKNAGVRSIIVMNPNYDGEIRELVRQMDWDVQVTSLRQPT